MVDKVFDEQPYRRLGPLVGVMVEFSARDNTGKGQTVIYVSRLPCLNEFIEIDKEWYAVTRVTHMPNETAVVGKINVSLPGGW